MTEQPSGRLYSVVTKHWAKIAAALVVLLGIIELVLGGLTANGSVEFYLMAWAGTTGGLWFLFEKAEKALSEGSRDKVVGWLGRSDLRGSIETIPSQFAALFDLVFGEKHLAWKCFRRSSLVSGITVATTSGAMIVIVNGIPEAGEWVSAFQFFALVLPIAMILNLVPDYLSLLETRWILGRAVTERRIAAPLFVDFGITIGIAIAFYMGVDWVLGQSQISGLEEAKFYVYTGGVISAFFTSVWLWLYAASVIVSRILLRMNSGVGFLLRVTDVEKQPFRSMGFVSVIIVSMLFALGLPLMLL